MAVIIKMQIMMLSLKYTFKFSIDYTPGQFRLKIIFSFQEEENESPEADGLCDMSRRSGKLCADMI